MAQNYISRGEVLTLVTQSDYTSGTPYRISGFNGVALFSVESGEQLQFQLNGIFEFTLADIQIGSLIYIDPDDNLTLDNGGLTAAAEHASTDIGRRTVFPVYGRAVTASDENGKFYCRLLQN